MKTFTLPGVGAEQSAVIAGMMRIEDLSDAEVRALYDAARASGVDVFDHADIYGGGNERYHGCEERFATALNLSASERAEITLQSKAGIVKWGSFDFSYEHLIKQVEGSLAALKTDYLDVLLLHRPDTLVEPEEVARAFDELEASGKVRHFGVSNHTPGQVELLRRFVRQPLVINQVQLSLAHAPLFAHPIAANIQGLDQSVSRDDGLLDYCRLHDITLQAWSPYQAGDGSGVFLGNPAYAELNAVIDRLATQYGVTPEGIATAWITRHPAHLQVVLGTTKPERLRASAEGSDVQLTRLEWYELFRAAGYTVP